MRKRETARERGKIGLVKGRNVGKDREPRGQRVTGGGGLQGHGRRRGIRGERHRAGPRIERNALREISDKKESARDRMYGHGKVFLSSHFREGRGIEGKSGPEYSLAWLTPK
jgi:hypothetical protein